MHTVMEFTLNYQYQVTERFIQRLPEKPVSCIKLRDQYKIITAEYGCSCNFRRTSNCYPSPVLHAIKNADEDISDVTMPLSRSLSKENELENIFDQMQVDCMEIEMGLLVRRKTGSGYEWIIEL